MIMQLLVLFKQIHVSVVAGKVHFSDSLELKQKIIESNKLYKALYETADNLTFELFTITGKATITDFSENPPKS